MPANNETPQYVALFMLPNDNHLYLVKVDSADDLRSSTVASARRLAVIRSNLSTKFALHLQGGHRVTRAGKRVVGEMVSK